MTEKLFSFGVDIPMSWKQKTLKNERRFSDLEGFLDEDYDGEHHMLWDNQKEKWCHLDDALSVMEEEYYSTKNENEQLKSDLDYFQRTYEIEERGLDIVAPMCTIGSPTPSRLELFKENEQLKSENEYLRCTIEYYKSNEECNKKLINNLHDYNQKLKKENEQLKKLLECSRKEANDYCEELMGKEEFIRLYKSQRDDAIKENEQLKQELAIYRKVANCGNCIYHNYDLYGDEDAFEVCDKGNDVTDGICEGWEY